MRERAADALSVHGIQNSPLVKRYVSTGLTLELLWQQLRDPKLVYLDLDTLCDLDPEALRDLLICTADMDGPEASPTLEKALQDEEAPLPCTPAECVVVTVDADGMVARMKLIEPPEDVGAPGRREMLAALFKRKITSGVKTEFIARLAERPIYGRFFRIAEGVPAQDGQDGAVEYFFNPSADLRPRVAEDGTVDYRALDFVKSVKAGDLLCRITPPAAGIDGVNIYGKAISAEAGGAAVICCGANTVLSGDGLEIRAQCDGQVFLRGSTVMVSQFLALEAVDYATGNIEFSGSVHIRGDVANGFTVKAEGDIVVSGVVENATLIAGGSIALCSGIKGGGSGLLDAGQDIRTLFIESCRGRAGGSIYADTILNSQLECGRQISVLGKRGSLMGGSCTAGESVCAAQIGNQAQVPTAVKVGPAAGLTDDKRQNLSAADRYHEMADRLSALVSDDARTMGSTAAFSQEVVRTAILILRLEQRADQLQQAADQPVRARRRVVQVLEALYPNVSLEIDGVFAQNTSLRTRCTIAQRQGSLHFAK